MLFPSLPGSGGIAVSVDISNSDIAGLTVRLTDPNLTVHVLYDGADFGGSLIETYTAASTLPNGDLSVWNGADPAGTWTLRVVDSSFLNNSSDGQVNSWSVSTVAAVPVPAAAYLFGSALLGIAGIKRKP